MTLRGWTALGGSAQRYTNPQGHEVSRREYLNAEAKTSGYANYSQYQRQAQNPTYQRIIAASNNPKEARRVTSPFSKEWAKQVQGTRPSSKKQQIARWEDLLEYADVDTGDEIWLWYHEE